MAISAATVRTGGESDARWWLCVIVRRKIEVTMVVTVSDGLNDGLEVDSTLVVGYILERKSDNSF